MEIHETPTAEAGMLIRRPVADVFEAIVDPAITTKFWFTHSSGRLDSGKEIRWEWRMYGVSATVNVSEIVKNKKIVMQWSDPPTTVVWTFTEMPAPKRLTGRPFSRSAISASPAPATSRSSRRSVRPTASRWFSPAPRHGWNRACRWA